MERETILYLVFIYYFIFFFHLGWRPVGLKKNWTEGNNSVGTSLLQSKPPSVS